MAGARTALSLPPGFTLQPGYLAPGAADALLDAVWSAADWQQREITLYGRRVMQPRLVAWCGDPGVSYRYSGLTLAPLSWLPCLPPLRDALAALAGRRFNHVLLNAYRDGRDSMGWHADNEPELGDRPVVASLSLGASRRFLLRPGQGGASTAIELRHGDLLLMSGDSQRDWRHALPRTRRPAGLRVNLTFREIR